MYNTSTNLMRLIDSVNSLKRLIRQYTCFKKKKKNYFPDSLENNSTIRMWLKIIDFIIFLITFVLTMFHTFFIIRVIFVL